MRLGHSTRYNPLICLSGPFTHAGRAASKRPYLETGAAFIASPHMNLWFYHSAPLRMLRATIGYKWRRWQSAFCQRSTRRRCRRTGKTDAQQKSLWIIAVRWQRTCRPSPIAVHEHYHAHAKEQVTTAKLEAIIVADWARCQRQRSDFSIDRLLDLTARFTKCEALCALRLARLVARQEYVKL